MLQIAENRATALLSQPLPDEDQRTKTMAHLSRVQAMLVYQVIRLLDGCIRQRVMAESLIPVLYSWNLEM